MQYTAADVHAVLSYMPMQRAANRGVHFNPDKFEPATKAEYYRGERLVKEVMLRYARTMDEARGHAAWKHRESPVVRKVYKGQTSYYWLIARSGPRK